MLETVDWEPEIKTSKEWQGQGEKISKKKISENSILHKSNKKTGPNR